MHAGHHAAGAPFQRRAVGRRSADGRDAAQPDHGPAALREGRFPPIAQGSPPAVPRPPVSTPSRFSRNASAPRPRVFLHVSPSHNAHRRARRSSAQSRRDGAHPARLLGRMRRTRAASIASLTERRARGGGAQAAAAGDGWGQVRLGVAYWDPSSLGGTVTHIYMYNSYIYIISS